MKTIKEIQQGCGHWSAHEGFQGDTGGLQDCQKDSLCVICKPKLETLKEVLEIIEQWKKDYCEDECKTQDGMNVIGFDWMDWELLKEKITGKKKK